MDCCNTAYSKRFRSVEIDHEINRVGCTTSKSASLAPNEIEVPLYFVGVWVREF
jgi:hypothetical protein